MWAHFCRVFWSDIILTLFVVFASTSCMRAPITKNSPRPVDDYFYRSLGSMQGRRITGQTIYPESKAGLFAEQPISLEVIYCTKSQIRIPIYVGATVYRTLILERTPTGFFLKHEHKKAGGQSHEINLYGGHTQGNGTAFMQFFPADTYTKNLMSLSTSSVWTLAFSSDYSTFSYLVESNGKLEMQIDFNLKEYLATTAGKIEQRSKR